MERQSNSERVSECVVLFPHVYFSGRGGIDLLARRLGVGEGGDRKVGVGVPVL